MKPSSPCIFIAISLLLAGCASLSTNANQEEERPLAFHDTRLQYALVTGDNETLGRDFDMKLPPSWVERVVAGAVLPVTVAAEAAFFPFATSIKTLAPSQEYLRSSE